MSQIYKKRKKTALEILILSLCMINCSHAYNPHANTTHAIIQRPCQCLSVLSHNKR